MRTPSTYLCLFLLAFALPVYAESDEQRINQLERDLEGLQRTIYSTGGKPGGLNTGMASSEVRFGEMDEKLRALEGRLEELDFQNRQLKEQLERTQKDNEMRLGDLEKSAGNSAIAPAVAPVVAPPVVAPAAPQASTDPQILRQKQTVPNAYGQFASANDHYDYAFRLLNQTQYDQAAQAFKSFVVTYPKDPLVGNAYYWTGETYYVQQQYEAAVDNFRLGFESMPTGPKAGDNLLKLGMSLSALKRNDEACIVLGQVISKFGTNSATLKNKAQTERERIGCR